MGANLIGAAPKDFPDRKPGYDWPWSRGTEGVERRWVSCPRIILHADFETGQDVVHRVYFDAAQVSAPMVHVTGSRHSHRSRK